MAVFDVDEDSNSPKVVKPRPKKLSPRVSAAGAGDGDDPDAFKNRLAMML